MDIYLFVYLILVAAPIGTVIHELGHVLGATLVRADMTTLTIGTGRIIGRFVFKKTVYTIRLFYFLGGMAGSRRKDPYLPGEQITIASGGPLMSLAAAGACFCLYNVFSNKYLLVLLLFNLWVAGVNIIPFRYKEKKSDGYTICMAVRNK
ncbi:Peptidase family M50 [Lentibacillus persicus]|uniref:Peptidase family M50 n=1 Tax=Lentibacillus persicus TaxID=640948 RepID=A0A1I1SY89_9BACI|nr:site-2 protease family protein [Lentibacillus persicus]SFD51414.1 Peptidase family M50 [Lentibacillus persicus]